MNFLSTWSHCFCSNIKARLPRLTKRCSNCFRRLCPLDHFLGKFCSAAKFWQASCSRLPCSHTNFSLECVLCVKILTVITNTQSTSLLSGLVVWGKRRVILRRSPSSVVPVIDHEPSGGLLRVRNYLFLNTYGTGSSLGSWTTLGSKILALGESSYDGLLKYGIGQDWGSVVDQWKRLF